MIRRSRSRRGRLAERALRLVLTTVLVTALVGPLPAFAGPAPTVITAAYGSFGATTIGSYQLNGSAALDGGVVKLTDAASEQAGSMFWKHKVALSDQGSFSTAFSYRMSDPDIDQGGADGMTFCIQPGSNTAVTQGGGLGYSGIEDSLAIEFDTYDNGPDFGDPDGNHIGVDLDGSVNSVVTKTAPFELLSGTSQYAWVDYDGTTDKLQVRIAETNTRPTDPTLEYTVDLQAMYGSDIFIGFTAATGGAWARHEIGSWYFSNDFSPAGLVPASTSYVMGPATITGKAADDTLLHGASTSVTFTATDSEGNPYQGAALAITAPEGGTVPASANTDANGEAVVTFTAPASGSKKSCSVRASATTGVYGAVTIATGDAKPVVNPNSGINQTFLGYNAYSSIAPTLTISDADDSTLTKAVVRVLDPGEGDWLELMDEGGRRMQPEGAPQDIDVSSDDTEIVLTGEASLATYARMLRTVVYREGTWAGDTRTIEFQVWDSVGVASAPKTSTMSVGTASQDASAAAHVNLDYLGNQRTDRNESSRGSRTPAISADGRYVVFLTGNAYDEGDDNSERNWYRKDLETGGIELVDTNFETGEAVNGTNLDEGDGKASLSADGRFVAFESESDGLVEGVWNHSGDHNIYVRDMVSGETTLVSQSMYTDEGVRFPDGHSWAPAISDDGRYVVFSSTATDLVEGDDEYIEDVFLKDLQTGVVTRVSQNAAGEGANNDAEQPEISADGSHVAFRSWADNLGPANPDEDDQIYVWEMATGEFEIVSKTTEGQLVDCCSWRPSLSADGRYVAFASDSEALNPLGSDSDDVYVHDTLTKTTQWVSNGWYGAGGPGGDDPWISDDGRYVTYQGWGWQKLPSHSAGDDEVLVVDLWQGTTEIASINADNEVADDDAWEPVIDADGSRVAFSAETNNLGDEEDNNYRTSVFYTDMEPASAEANAAPWARWDRMSGSLDAPLSVSAPGVLANDTDHDGDTLTVALAGEPLNGDVVLNSDGSFTYTPDDGFAGSDRFLYRAYDGTSWSAPTAVDVSILRVEHTWIISTDASWTQQPDVNGEWKGSRSPGMNASGSFVGFLTGSCLSEEDTNTALNWYLKNTQTGATTLVDKNMDGMASTNNGMSGGSGKIAVSANGQRVAFDSYDSDIVLADHEGTTDVFVRDMASGETTLVSQMPGVMMTSSVWPSIDDAGRYVAFSGYAMPADASEPAAGIQMYQQIYLRDLASGETTLVSHNGEGMPANEQAGYADISADGRKIAFMSYATDIVPGVDSGSAQIYVYDIATGAITHVSKSETRPFTSWADSPTLNADGSKVSFITEDALVAGDTNGSHDVYVRDLEESSTVCVSVDPQGVPAGANGRPVISDDGLSVAFVSWSGAIVEGYTNDTVFVRDLVLDRTFVASQGESGGRPNGSSQSPAISANGRLVAYDSWASNIVMPDVNGTRRDVFLAQLSELDRDYTPTVARSGTGSSVYASIAYSKVAWKSAGTVVLARWDDGVDAFSAAGLAGSYGAPVLSTPKSFLSAPVKAEIKRLGAKKVFVIGGTKAVFPGVVTSLKKMGVSVERLGGDGRYATSVAVGKRIKKHDGSKFSDYVIVANGTSKSARSAAALAYQLKAPVIYTYRGSYSAATKSFIATGGFKKMIVVGPTSLVSTTVAKKLAAAGHCSYTRAYGSDRYGTAVAVANQQLKYGPTRIAHVGLVSGDTFMYAPWAGPAIARMGGVLCATAPTKLSSPTSKWLTGHAGEILDIRLMGNGSSPTNAVGQAAALAATGPLVN